MTQLALDWSADTQTQAQSVGSPCAFGVPS
jgi:hypothetical protein